MLKGSGKSHGVLECWSDGVVTIADFGFWKLTRKAGIRYQVSRIQHPLLYFDLASDQTRRTWFLSVWKLMGSVRFHRFSPPPT
jgi:hypothetical protein